MQLRLKLDNLKEAKKIACSITNDRIFFICICQKQAKRTRQGWTTRRQYLKYNITRFFIGGRPKWILQFSVYQRGYYFISSSRCIFQEAKSDYLGQLIVTQEMVAKKTKAMNDNKSPGVDGIPPRLLMEKAEQISIPLAGVFNLSLKEGVVPFEWK